MSPLVRSLGDFRCQTASQGCWTERTTLRVTDNPLKSLGHGRDGCSGEPPWESAYCAELYADRHLLALAGHRLSGTDTRPIHVANPRSEQCMLRREREHSPENPSPCPSLTTLHVLGMRLCRTPRDLQIALRTRAQRPSSRRNRTPEPKPKTLAQSFNAPCSRLPCARTASSSLTISRAFAFASPPGRGGKHPYGTGRPCSSRRCSSGRRSRTALAALESRRSGAV